MFPVWQAAVLGGVQGLTEFLPISSSAHLKLVPWIFGWQPPENEMAFDVALHLGTVLSVVIFFFFDWLLIIASYIGDVRMKRWKGGKKGSLLPKVILGTIPAAIIGKLVEKPVENFFYKDESNIWILGVSLAVFGLVLLLSERFGKQERDLDGITYPQALMIGTAQALALMPGVSRSGITIVAALLIGLTRPSAARFSFLLATPITIGAVALKIGDLKASDWNAALFAGLAASAVVGIVAIMFLLRYVQTRRYAIFVYYRWILAAIVIGLYFYRQNPAP